MKTLNHLWRIFATGICFAYFGIGALLLTLFAFPIQKLLFKQKQQQKFVARKTVHITFKWFISFMGYSGVFKFDVSRAKQLAKIKGHLVLANHPSLIDVVVLISTIPNADCVVKAHLFKNPFIRGVVTNTGYISNADPEGLLQDCSDSLEAGNNLIIFPEGTRTKPGQPVSFQRGAANIAVRCQAKIAYVLISVTPTTLTKSEPWYKVPERKAMFSARLVNSELVLPAFQTESVSRDVRQFNDKLQQFFREELKELV